ncbi:IS5 family transposase [Streptomyces sp. NPDC057302]|uniref:IS5 family transposase n=1 Tax=Streptomyces sp. NPDC057302 TaxID=3346094 RepID=UPI00362C322A
MGRSRGGLSTKVHLAVDWRRRPLSILLTPGQAGDNAQLVPLLEAIRVPRLGPGRLRSRPDRVIADKAYSHPSTRAELRRRRIATTIPEHAAQKIRRRGRPPCLDRALYHDRNVVERCFNRLKQWRGPAARCAKRAAIHRTEVVIAAIRHHDLALLIDRTRPSRSNPERQRSLAATHSCHSRSYRLHGRRARLMLLPSVRSHPGEP